MNSMDFSRDLTGTLTSLPPPTLGSLCTAPSPGSLAAAALSSDDAAAAALHWFQNIPCQPPHTVPGYHSAPQTLAELSATPHSITPRDRVVQALSRTIRALVVHALTQTVRDLQEDNEIAEYLEHIAELKAQRGWRDSHIAESKVQIAEAHAHTEAQLRKLYELQLLAPTCEACHITFNEKNKEGKIEVKASRNATVCSASLGDPDCPKRRKAQEMYDRRAEQKGVDQTALHGDESTGD